MAWQAPKTNWTIRERVNGMYAGDWFNVEDYERIVGNLGVLRIFGENVYGTAIAAVNMPSRFRNGYPRAADFNAIEENLLSIAQKTVIPAAYSGRKTWVANGATPTVDDLNRIEGTILGIYENCYAVGTWGEFIPSDSESLLTADGEQFMALEV